MVKVGLILTLGLVAAAQTAPLALLPLLMQALGMGADQLGLAIGVGLLTTILLAPVAGALADRARPALPARCGLAAICVASALLCSYTALVSAGVVTEEHAFAVVLMTRIVNGTGVAALHPAAQAWLWAGEDVMAGTRLQGRASAAQNAGRLLGPLAVALIGGLGAAGTLAALVAVACLALLVLLLLPSPVMSSVTSSVLPMAAETRAASGTPAWHLVFALFALHVLGGGAQFLLGPLLLARLGLDGHIATRWAGWLMALTAIAAIAGNLLSHRVSGRWRAAAGAGLATAGSVVLAASETLSGTAVGIVVLAVGIGIAVPSTMAALMRGATAQSRGRVAGRTSAIQAAAYAAAAPVCGILVEIDPALAAASLTLPAVVALLLLASARRRHAEQPLSL
ncbi:MFS transporter [Paracraurococcus lichenis]|uniref:MFS transporter n=1 Tax=Paracraurococcus lichenis TaxID=3064888 RepID=A0ABT9E947_9PROT|nr:MFS transporter [Paracraurococcus sp. LOR1-02]MDO9712508.1 MFS transporter [Paracraurococcus sp. LOR1-02]